MAQHPHSDPGPILVVDDEPSIRTALCEVLNRTGHPVLVARDGQEALVLLEQQAVWLVVTDLRMPRLGGLDLLREIKRRFSQTLVVLITGYATLESAIEAMRAGASDYLMKPFDNEAVAALIRRLEEGSQVQGTAAQAPIAAPPALLGSLETHTMSVLGRHAVQLIAHDPAMLRILHTLEGVAISQATILIQGESGTGKEVLARYVHGRSPRAHRPFVAVNCAALPGGLLESELFGYERGAFTGAVARRPGKFEQAHSGTLLLDEISEMDLALQSKLLRVIQEREVDRLGGKSSIAVDIRIIATTNRSLRREVEAGRFREDLFYRLHVFPVTIPPLRERPLDIPGLVAHFVQASAARNQKAVTGVTAETAELLLQRVWKGNVRELENVIERGVLLSKGPLLEPQDIASDSGDLAQPLLVAASGDHTAAPVSIWEMERELIMRTLERVNGNRTHAAKQLEISIRTLRNKLREYRQIETGSANSTGQRTPDTEVVPTKATV